MDSILPALLAVAILVLASLMLGRSSFTSIRVVTDAWQDAEERSVERVRSDITITSITTSGSTVDVTVQNNGATPVVDFSRMDLVVQYSSESSSYTKYLDYTTESSPQPSDTWRVVSINNDVINPRILNTGENMSIQIKLSPAPGSGSHWLQVTTELGISASLFFT